MKRIKVRLNNSFTRLGQALRSGFVELYWQTPSDLTTVPLTYLGFDEDKAYRQFHAKIRVGSYPYDAWDAVPPTKSGFSSVFANKSNSEIASWLKSNKVLVSDDAHGGGYQTLTYSGTAGYNEFYSMMRGELSNVDHLLPQMKVQTFIALVLFGNRLSNRYWYAVGRSCPIYYKKLYKVNYTGDGGFDPSILDTVRPDSVKQLRNVPSIRDGTVIWSQDLITYDTIQIDYDNAPKPASNPGYTVGFSFGVNGFVPIQVPGQGPYSSREMFKTWADMSQSFNLKGTLDLTGLKNQESAPNVSSIQTQNNKRVTAFLKNNLNLKLPTNTEYAEVVEVPSKGDIITTNLLNTYKVLNVVGNPYSPDGFYVDVEGY